MHGLIESDLVPLWERGEAGGPVVRTAALLALALPEASPDELDDLTIGQREMALLTLRELTFGARLPGFVQCPQCAEPLELELGPEQRQAVIEAEPSLGEHELISAGYRLRFRPLTCGDLRAARGAADKDTARLLLVQRCVRDAWLGDEPVPARELPAEVVAALAERLAECDPQAEISFGITCPECGHGWRAVLDLAAYLWTEVSAEARRLLEEVHVLARSYGWREPDILALSTRRRRFYLELVA